MSRCHGDFHFDFRNSFIRKFRGTSNNMSIIGSIINTIRTIHFDIFSRLNLEVIVDFQLENLVGFLIFVSSSMTDNARGLYLHRVRLAFFSTILSSFFSISKSRGVVLAFIPELGHRTQKEFTSVQRSARSNCSDLL